MNYKDFTPEIFKQIPAGEKIFAKVLELEIKEYIKVFAFREEPGWYCCLLPVTDTKQKLPKLNGLQIEYQQFKMLGDTLSWYVLIECRFEGYLDNFIKVLKEVIAEIDKSKHETVHCLNVVIYKWRHFFSAPAEDIMSENDIIGLVGELLCLERLIATHNGDAVAFWVANRGEEDFVKGSNVIEVKATLKQKHEHVINGIDQLLVVEGRRKHILSIIFNLAEGEPGINLPLLVNKCASKLVDYPQAYDDYFAKLKARGYDYREAEFYLRHSFTYVRGGYFLVDTYFPKLTSQELAVPLSSRISKVRYTIDMEGLLNKDFILTSVTDIMP